MAVDPMPLKMVFLGWNGYQTSLLHAVAPLNAGQLAFRPQSAPGSDITFRSAGELVTHISQGRVDWFTHMGSPGIQEIGQQLAAVRETAGAAPIASELVRQLEISWQAIANVLEQWTTADLTRTYPHTYWGKTYAVSYQWTIWRILTHDVQHGGELALLLGMQGVHLPELGDLGGHLTEPPLV